MSALWDFIRQRAAEKQLSLVEVARMSGKSRQTLYALSSAEGRLPELQTLVDVALVLGVHPLRLIHLVFDDYRLPVQHERGHQARGDRSIFLGDITIPDGSIVAAGSRFTKTWELQNVGTVPWENRHLRCMDEEIVVYARNGEVLKITQGLVPSATRIDIPYTAPGGIVRLSVDFEAPSLPSTCLSYWKTCYADGAICFPDSVGLSVKVQVLSMTATRKGVSR